MRLTEFLLARIAEDEAAARKDEPWLWTDDENRPIPDAELALVSGTDLRMEVPVGRWLAECEAKRRIVEAFEEERVRRDIYNHDYDSGEYDFNANDLRARLASNAHCRGLEIAMLLHAAPYVDHPDYDEEWRP